LARKKTYSFFLKNNSFQVFLTRNFNRLISVYLTGSCLTLGLGEVDGMGPFGSCLLARRDENWSVMPDLPELISDAPDRLHYDNWAKRPRLPVGFDQAIQPHHRRKAGVILKVQ
jgi:hypothetical protein